MKPLIEIFSRSPKSEIHIPEHRLIDTMFSNDSGIHDYWDDDETTAGVPTTAEGEE